MDNSELIIIIIGAAFVILGIISFLWSRKEEGAWYGSVSTKIDVREFLDRNPGRPEPNALRIGGVISVLVGVAVLMVALGIHIWG